MKVNGKIGPVLQKSDMDMQGWWNLWKRKTKNIGKKKTEERKKDRERHREHERKEEENVLCSMGIQ